MSLPKVSIEITPGGLGRVPALNDGVAGLLITGKKNKTASSSDTLYNTPKPIFSLEDLDALNITKTSHKEVYTQVEDFYSQAGKGGELWLVLLPTDETFANIFAASGNADKLAEAAQGRIRLLGISHGETTSGSLKAATEGLKGNVHAAVPLAQGFAKRQRSSNRPLSIIVAGSNLDDPTDLKTYTGGDNNRVSMLISGREVGSKVAALGLVLGTLSRLPVQRSLARVKNGALPISAATLTNGDAIEKHAGKFSDLHEKRYLFFRNYTGLTGYYIADDLALTKNTDDNATVALARVIDKTLRLTYITYIEELADEILLEDGKLSAANVKYLEGKIENVINETMTNNAEISAVAAYIDPEQNILATDELEVELRVTPVGYSKIITVKIGFINPQNL